VCLAVLAVPTHARDAWKKDLEAALAARYPLSTQVAKKILGVRVKAGSDLQQIGAVMTVAIDGVNAEPTITGKGSYSVTVVENGVVQKAGGGWLGGLRGNSVRPGRRMLKPTDRVTPIEFQVYDDVIRLAFVTVDSETFLYEGTQFSDHLYGAVSFRFPKGMLPTASIDQVAQAIDAVFVMAPDKSAGPAKIALGQSQDEVRRSFGTPERVIELGAKVIWAYKDMKVVFVDGTVADVQ
jgi:hypothetical protein